jgi:hypothetical protein
MTEDQGHHALAVTPTARRQLTDHLPEAVATAAYAFITGPLRDNPTVSASSSARPWTTGTAHAAAPTASSTGSTTRVER